MWRQRGFAAGLLRDAVEPRELIRIDHGGSSLWLGAWLQDRCRQGFDLPEAEHLYRRLGPAYDQVLREAAFGRLQLYPGPA